MPQHTLAHVVVGTAGHIDHGKSSLVKALTGTDPDRWEEEKRRGMTIDLGYAHYTLPDGRRLGLIDVPGHERFVRNMVAGATGVDVVLLVIAADDGVMPQTREHLQILELLGLSRGIVVLNKIDLVDDEMRELALSDVQDFIAGTVLAGAEVIPVSAITGEGLDALRAAIAAKVAEVPEPATGGLFRMPVQRAFSKPGHGTVVTGVPLGGVVRLGERLEVLPTGEVGKVRGLQALGEPCEAAQAGHRTAIQISDVGAKEVVRGMVVAEPGAFAATHFVEATFRYLSGFDRPLKSHARVRLHVGTAEVMASLVLLESTEMAPGSDQLVQLRCAEPVVAADGDRFVVRRESPMETLGGGLVIGTSGRKLRSERPEVLAHLHARHAALQEPRRRLELTLLEQGLAAPTRADLRPLVRLPAPEIDAHLAALTAEGRVVALGRTGRHAHADAWAGGLAAIETAVREFHRAQPLAMHADLAAIRTAAHVPDVAFDPLVAALTERGTLAVEGSRVRLATHQVALSEADRATLAGLEDLYRQARFATPTPAEALAQAGAPGERGQRLYQLLRDQGRLVELAPDVVVHADVVAEARAKIVEVCGRDGHLESAKFRDLVGTTRKYAIPLLEHFDRTGLTVRVDNRRTLRQHHHTVKSKDDA